MILLNRTALAVGLWCLLVLLLVYSPVDAGTVSSVNVLNLPVNAVRIDPTQTILYASVPSSAGAGLGNSITRINLATDTIMDSTFVGSEPTVFNVSPDGSQMYVFLNGSDKLREFNPVTLTPGPQVTVVNNYQIGDLAVVPGSPNTFVGSILRNGSPPDVGIGVWHYDGTSLTNNIGATGIAAVNLAYSSDPSVFYATSGTQLAKVTLGPGDSLSAQYGPPLGGNDPGIAIGGNLVVSAAGRATDTTTFTAAGTFSGVANSGNVAIDTAANKVYFIHGPTITIFNMTTFIPIDTLTVPQVTGGVFDLFRFGAHGLAFSTDNGKVFTIQSSSIGVPEPSSFALAAFAFAGLAAWGWRRRGCSG